MHRHEPQCSTEHGVFAAPSGYHLSVVTLLKHRLALAALVGGLLIPLLTANNGGLSHLLFCEAEVSQPFAIAAGDSGEVAVTSSRALDRDTIEENPFEGSSAVTPVCEGVHAELSADPLSNGRVLLTVTLINESDTTWRGSIGLDATGVASNADLTATIGEVGPGETSSATLELRVADGQTELGGTLLLGP